MEINNLKISSRSLFWGFLLLPSTWLVAAEKVDREININADSNIEIFNIRGTVEIKGWNKNNLKINGTLDEESTGLVVDNKGQEVIVKVKMPKQISPKKGSKLVIYVPKNSTINALGVNSKWTLKDAGATKINSVSGEIVITNSRGDVALEVVSAPVSVHTVQGNLKVTNLSGKIEVADVDGSVLLNTVEGELNLKQPIIDSARLSSVNGKILIDGKLSKTGNLSVTSVDGDVFLKVGATTDLNCDLKALHGGDIKNHLKIAGEESQEFSGKHFSLVIGEGEAKVEATTISGTIHLQN